MKPLPYVQITLRYFQKIILTLMTQTINGECVMMLTVWYHKTLKYLFKV